MNQVVERMHPAVAAAISRRSALKRLAALGAGVGLSISGLGLGSKNIAGAWGSCTGGACGPSPLCPGSCQQNRPYNQFYCGSGANCWEEYWSCGACYMGTPGYWMCCDQCATNVWVQFCSSCPGSYYACICRWQSGSCN